jgi:geranylgeranyl diphosphate synthase type II
MELIQKYFQQFENHLKAHPLNRQPYNLYGPADYILSLGGKRLRPVFVLLGCDLFSSKAEKALPAAMSIEVFHNFTLLHDDIMDKADIRRGKPTVHVKYNINTAILTGDVMMIQAYQYLLDYNDPVMIKKLLTIFNKMAFDVCEGQQMDMDFEIRNDVTIDQYILMITYKTSVLIAAAIQIGALIGGADDSDQRHLYEFAKNFGIAFQLQDDILDAFGDEIKVGKKTGGDILQNKKTYLFLKALELADSAQKSILSGYYYDKTSTDDAQKIAEVKKIFEQVNVLEYARQLIEAYKDLAISHLLACKISEDSKLQISEYINDMITRSF